MQMQTIMEHSSLEEQRRIRRRVLLICAGDEPRVLSLEEFISLLEGQTQLPRNRDGNVFFSCYLTIDDDDTRGQGLPVPKDMLRDLLRTVQAIRDAGDTVDDLDETTTTNGGGICGVFSTLAETVIGGIKSALKGASRVYRVAEILTGAFGPSRTRQKVERCLAEVGCLLVVLSLVFSLIAATNGNFRSNTSALFWHALSLALMLVHGVLMVMWANKMAANDAYSNKGGLIVTALSLITTTFFILVAALF